MISALADHLRAHALLTGSFTLRSGAETSWYVDARRTTYDGAGAHLVGAAVLSVLDSSVTAVGGMTMGADPIAIATAMSGAAAGRPLTAFSVRKEAKAHGTGGRLAGSVGPDSRVAVIEDTTTTGGSMLEAVDVLRAEGIEVVQAITLVDRSGGAAAKRCADVGLRLTALVTPEDLGVST